VIKLKASLRKVYGLHHDLVNRQGVSHNVVSSTPRGIRTLVVIDTDCIDSCKFNYHMNTTTTATVKLVSNHISDNRYFRSNFYLTIQAKNIHAPLYNSTPELTNES